jgi:hypothetical protein
MLEVKEKAGTKAGDKRQGGDLFIVDNSVAECTSKRCRPPVGVKATLKVWMEIS